MRKSSLSLVLTLVITAIFISSPTQVQALEWDDEVPSGISLTIEVRSPRQAIITLTDARLPEIIQRVKDSSGYSATWTVRLGENSTYRLNMQTNAASPDEIKMELEKEIESFIWGRAEEETPIGASLRPHSPYDSFIPLEEQMADSFSCEQKEDGFVWEVSVPDGESIDFSTEAQYVLAFEVISGGSVADDESFETVFEARDVVDMRNYGQEYDIGFDAEDFSRMDIPERIYGMTFEQAEQLYFSPIQSRYVTANTVVEDVYVNADSIAYPYSVTVYELIYFDDNGDITQIINKVIAADADNHRDGMNGIINVNTVFYSAVKFVYGALDGDVPVGYLFSSDTLLDTLDSYGTRNIDAYIEQDLIGMRGFANVERHE